MNWLSNLWHYFFSDRTFGSIRSPRWMETQRAFIKANPVCAVTGKKGTLLNPLNVHHIRPFHLHPELELEWSNLITLRRDMHFLFGHFLMWASFNENVVEDAKVWNQRILNRP